MSKDGDQIEELEALMAIFPNELTVLNNEYGHRCLELVLQPEEDASKCYVLAALTVKYPLDYPDVEPQVQVQARKGLSENQVEELQSTAQRVASENIGMPSTFVVTDVLREWLRDNNVEGQDGSMYADMLRRMQQKEVETKKKVEKAAIVAAAQAEHLMSGDKQSIDKEEEERIRRRQAGTAVTIESFMAWKAAFDEEQRLAALQNGKEIVKDDRLTGKQWFVARGKGTAVGDGEELDFGDLADYEGLLLEDDEENDEDYEPSEGDDDDDDEYGSDSEEDS